MTAGTTRRKVARKIAFLDEDATALDYTRMVEANRSFNTVDWLVGRSVTDYYDGMCLTEMGFGALPDTWVQDYKHAEPRYVIYSGDTPLAWQDAEGHWTFPAVAYSLKLHETHWDLIDVVLKVVKEVQGR